MAELRPFRAWRYASGIDLGQVLAPPYDVIPVERRQGYYQRHPYNVVRLVLGMALPEDEEHGNRYTRARATFRIWQSQKVLVRDPAPALYLLQQRFVLPNGRQLERLGIIGRLRLTPWREGVFPHERTFPDAKADRLALLRATGLQFSPVFLLYPDENGTVLKHVTVTLERKPVATWQDDDGVIHTLWRVDKVDEIKAVITALRDRPLYVADGHHRYETGLMYQRERRVQTKQTRDQPYDYILAYLAAMEDPGIIILPTHRCVQNIPPVERASFLRALAQHFNVETVASDRHLVKRLESAGIGQGIFGLILPGDDPGHLLRLRPTPETQAMLLAADPLAVIDLDVAVLQTLVLEPLLGIARDPVVQGQHLVYETQTQVAIDQGRSGRYQAVFLVNPTGLHQLRNLADAGAIAPPKATYFYPKLPSGAVIHSVWDL
ncbi:MAG TPA: DUF1015 domain-containing protein [Anaerolineae bacterium]|nr:DUF1015 domain-containing protein [Anaerolineae bacterium]